MKSFAGPQQLATFFRTCARATRTRRRPAGCIKSLAEQTLKPALQLCEMIDGKWRAAVAKAEPLIAA